MPSSRGSSQPRNQPMSLAAPALQSDSLLLRHPESLKVGFFGISIQEVDWMLVSKVGLKNLNLIQRVLGSHRGCSRKGGAGQKEVSDVTV